jgi:hypothetical protein
MRLKLERGDAHCRPKFDRYGVFDEVIGNGVWTVSVDPLPRLGIKELPDQDDATVRHQVHRHFNTQAESVAFVRPLRRC